MQNGLDGDFDAPVKCCAVKVARLTDIWGKPPKVSPGFSEAFKIGAGGPPPFQGGTEGRGSRRGMQEGRQPPALFNDATPPRTHRGADVAKRAHLATAAPPVVASVHPLESGRGRSAISGDPVTPCLRGLAIGTGLRAYRGRGGAAGCAAGASEPGVNGRRVGARGPNLRDGCHRDFQLLLSFRCFEPDLERGGFSNWANHADPVGFFRQ